MNAAVDPSRRRVLVVSDRADVGWADVHRSGATYLLLAFGAAADSLARNAARVRQLDCRLVHLQPYSARAQTKLGEFYPEFVYRFARDADDGRALLRSLASRNEPNLWWFGETCEKSPLRGPLVHQLYRLALLDCVLEDMRVDEVWLWLDDADLRACIESNVAAGPAVRTLGKPAARAFTKRLSDNRSLLMLLRLAALRIQLVGTLLATRFVLWRAGIKRYVGDGTPLIGLYSRFPALWRGAFSANPEERYFGRAHAKLERVAPLRYFVWLSDIGRLWSDRKNLRRSWERLAVTPLASYLTLRDLVAVLFGVRVVLAYVGYHFRVAGKLRAPFLRWDIAALWDRELRRNLTGIEIPRNILFFRAIRNLTASVKLAALVNPLEFQPMERAIWAGAAGRTVRVAFQHSAYCRNHLMYYFARDELAEHELPGNSVASPLPDFFVAAGTRPFADLRSNGVPPSRIGLCGAIRYNDLRLEERRAPRERAPRVLTLTAQLRAESVGLVKLVAAAAAVLPREYQFVFRHHYHCPIDGEVAREFAKVAPAADHAVLDLHAPLQEQVHEADFVIVGATTAAVEVLALGHVPLVYFEPGELPLCPLLDFSGVFRPFSTADGLVSELTDQTRGSGNFDSARREAMEQMFFRLDGEADKRFMEFLSRVTAYPGLS